MITRHRIQIFGAEMISKKQDYLALQDKDILNETQFATQVEYEDHTQ